MITASASNIALLNEIERLKAENAALREALELKTRQYDEVAAEILKRTQGPSQDTARAQRYCADCGHAFENSETQFMTNLRVRCQNCTVAHELRQQSMEDTPEAQR